MEGWGGHRRERRGLKVVVLLVGVWCRSLAGSAATKGAEARGERKGWWFPGLFGGDGGRGEERGGEGAGHILTKGPRHRSRGKQTRSSRSGPRSCQSASSASSSCPNNRAQGPRPGGDEAVPEASQTRAATSPRISPSFFRPYTVHRTNLVPCFTPLPASRIRGGRRGPRSSTNTWMLLEVEVWETSLFLFCWL